MVHVFITHCENVPYHLSKPPDPLYPLRHSDREGFLVCFITRRVTVNPNRLSHISGGFVVASIFVLIVVALLLVTFPIGGILSTCHIDVHTCASFLLGVCGWYV